MTKKIFAVLVALCTTFTSMAQDNLSALMPMPNHIEHPKGRAWHIIEGRTAIEQPADSLHFIAETIAGIIAQRTDVPVGITSKGGKADIKLRIDKTLEGAEHYRLQISQRGIVLSGSTTAALFRGAMTLDQLLLGDVVATAKDEMSPIIIDDAPRFACRALMLDPARHFLPVKDVKFYIDQMAKYKYNVLQLHLTDDQGWRVAINSHPRLASPRHYTQDEIGRAHV